MSSWIASETHHEMNSLLVVVKSHLFPQFSLAEVTGGRGEFAVNNRGWAGTVPGPGGTAAVNCDGHAIHRKRGGGGSYTHNSDSDSQ